MTNTKNITEGLAKEMGVTPEQAAKALKGEGASVRMDRCGNLHYEPTNAPTAYWRRWHSG